MKNRHVAALTIAATAAIVPGPRASAKADLKTAGDSCKKEGSTAAASDGHELKCTAKRWAVTANTIPEKDMPGGKPNPGALYPNRPGRQKEDQEAAVGGAVRLTGRTTTVTAARITPGGQLVLHVKVFNRDSKAKSYNTFDWQAQTPNGQVIDPTFSSSKDLGSGDLVSGGVVEGDVSFDVTGKGPFFAIYKPDPINAARGIWQVPAGAAKSASGAKTAAAPAADGSAPTANAIPSGQWLVPAEAKPGTYRTKQAECYWKRLKAFTGDISTDVIASNFTAANGGIVTIAATDKGFDSNCEWTRIS